MAEPVGRCIAVSYRSISAKENGLLMVTNESLDDDVLTTPTCKYMLWSDHESQHLITGKNRMHGQNVRVCTLYLDNTSCQN